MLGLLNRTVKCKDTYNLQSLNGLRKMDRTDSVVLRHLDGQFDSVPDSVLMNGDVVSRSVRPPKETLPHRLN